MHETGNKGGSPFPRWVDALVAGIGLAVLSPLFLIVALAIKRGSKGPVFHRALRAGRNGGYFTVNKFRSMRIDAAVNGSGITKEGDPRITDVGKVLRKFKIDELPQLINVLRGEMSLVGPRPEDPRYVEFYPVELREILAYKPGITSAASLHFRNESALLTTDDHEREYREKILPMKLRMDLEYMQKAGFWQHVGLIFKTVFSVGRVIPSEARDPCVGT